MNLAIDLECCTGCGACVAFCPGQVLAMDDTGHSFEKYPDHCWYCGVCQVECGAECINMLFPYLIR